MNCQSCRKRRVRCDRQKPRCKACTIIDTRCIYDALPNKRGPKCQSMRELTARMNSLERQLEDAKSLLPAAGATPLGSQQPSACDVAPPASHFQARAQTTSAEGSISDEKATLLRRLAPKPTDSLSRAHVLNETEGLEKHTALSSDLLDVYFTFVHDKPYAILEEHATREQFRAGRAASFLIAAINAASITCASHLFAGCDEMIAASQSWASQSRAEIDVDEPSIVRLQALLLLVIANSWAGHHQKSWMLLSHAVGMAYALNLHHDTTKVARDTTMSPENSRQLFWTCYLMERSVTCEAGATQLIWNESIQLRWPARQSADANISETLQSVLNKAAFSARQTSFRSNLSSMPMLLEVSKILGFANQYLTAGGAKNDSRFPWHSESTLYQIVASLNAWEITFKDLCNPLESIFEHEDCVKLLLGKLLYHMIHCLIYRPFLPVDFRELSASGEHQSWQTRITSQCLMHADAIEHIVAQAKAAGIMTWPPILGFCIYVAGTVHMHGAYYSFGDNDVSSHYAYALSNDIAYLKALQRSIPASGNHLQALEAIRDLHEYSIQSLSTNPSSLPQPLQMNEFSQRYWGVLSHQTLSNFAGDTPNIANRTLHPNNQLDFTQLQNFIPFTMNEYDTQPVQVEDNAGMELLREHTDEQLFDSESSFTHVNTNPALSTNDRFIHMLEHLAREDLLQLAEGNLRSS